MNKCLVTKLNGSISNDSILKIGEFRILVKKTKKPQQNTQYLSLSANKASNIEIIGDGYFTDETLSTNKGKSMYIPIEGAGFHVSNGDFEISIKDKYSLKKLEVNRFGFKSIDDLKYSPNLNFIKSWNKEIAGDISAFSNLTALTSLELQSPNIAGDISAFSNLTALTSLELQSPNIAGDISAFSNLTALTSLSLNSPNIAGDISAFSNLTAVTSLSLKNSTVTGDISKLPAKTRFLSLLGKSGGNMTWTNRVSSSNIIAIEGSPMIDNIDKMLQDQAKCVSTLTGSDDIWMKTITGRGIRTSASDAAVQALQSKGYTVSITPA